MTEVKVQVNEIKVEGRFRKDLGDIPALARSIETIGLIHAITVTPDLRLLAGGRRLAAFKYLGRDEIDARVANNLTDAAAWLTVERDENTARKAMTPSELVALGRALEELHQPAAEARRRIGRRVTGTPVPQYGTFGDTREAVAKALGVSTATYSRAKRVVMATEDPGLSDEDRAVALQTVAEMDSGETSITASYERVRSLRDCRPDPAWTMDSVRDQRRAITNAAIALSGMSHGLEKIAELHPGITSEEAAQWVSDLSEPRRTLDSLIKRLKERSNV